MRLLIVELAGIAGQPVADVAQSLRDRVIKHIETIDPQTSDPVEQEAFRTSATTAITSIFEPLLATRR